MLAELGKGAGPGSSDLQCLFQYFDTDSDGGISPDEWCASSTAEDKGLRRSGDGQGLSNHIYVLDAKASRKKTVGP